MMASYIIASGMQSHLIFKHDVIFEGAHARLDAVNKKTTKSSCVSDNSHRAVVMTSKECKAKLYPVMQQPRTRAEKHRSAFTKLKT